MSSEPTFMDALASPEFLGLVILAFVLLACVAYLRRETSPPDVDWLEGVDSTPPVELPAARQAHLSSIAEPRRLGAPIAIPESDPTRARTTFHKDSNPEREQLVRQYARRVGVVRRFVPRGER